MNLDLFLNLNQNVRYRNVFIFIIYIFNWLNISMFTNGLCKNSNRFRNSIFQVTTKFYVGYNVHIYYYLVYYFYTLLAPVLHIFLRKLIIFQSAILFTSVFVSLSIVNAFHSFLIFLDLGGED